MMDSISTSCPPFLPMTFTISPCGSFLVFHSLIRARALYPFCASFGGRGMTIGAYIRKSSGTSTSFVPRSSIVPTKRVLARLTIRTTRPMWRPRTFPLSISTSTSSRLSAVFKFGVSIITSSFFCWSSIKPTAREFTLKMPRIAGTRCFSENRLFFTKVL